MNPSTMRTFDRILNRMERRADRPVRRFTASPFVLGFGLILADILLTKQVPMMWATLLPGGLEQASRFRGWPGLIWNLSILLQERQAHVQMGIGVVAFLALILSYRMRTMRFLVWLCAVGIIALNAAVLVITLRASMAASALDLGMGLD